MTIDHGCAGGGEHARLHAEILRAYRRCTHARQHGDGRIARHAEDEMNWLLDQLPRPRTPLDDEGPAPAAGPDDATQP